MGVLWSGSLPLSDKRGHVEGAALGYNVLLGRFYLGFERLCVGVTGFATCKMKDLPKRSYRAKCESCLDRKDNFKCV